MTQSPRNISRHFFPFFAGFPSSPGHDDPAGRVRGKDTGIGAASGLLFGLGLLLSGPPVLADEPGNSLEGRLEICMENNARRVLLPKCLERLMEVEETRDMLEEVPALRDGRLSFEDLRILAERNLIVEEAIVPRDQDPNEDAANEPFEEDGRTPVYLSEEQLRLLRSAEIIHLDPVALDPILGPIELQNYPPVPPPDPFPLPGPGFSPPPPNPNQLDVGAFLEDFHNAIVANVNGYALKIRYQGQTIGLLQWNWARNPNVGDSPALGWHTYRRMHIASISKFMTTIGLIHLFEQVGGMDADDFMYHWLPAYWNRTAGANENITFAHLMDHRSGFSTGGSASDWQTMKSNVEAGVSFFDIGDSDYENMNFGLIRILMATIGGYIHPNTNFGFEFINDMLWDVLTQVAYDDYMQTYVFNPVGAHPTLDTNIYSVLAYRWDSSTAGWNSGNLAGSSGGVGWHMTVTEILDVVRAFRHANIVSLGGMSDIILGSWGLNSPIGGESTAAGNIYYKAGRWTKGGDPATDRTEQCFVMLMPNDMELVVFVNSQITDQGMSLTNLVRTLFINNIVGP
jgi:CubicO group peptidase (beta-lactamase class C family)